MEACAEIIAREPAGDDDMEKVFATVLEQDEIHLVAAVLKAYLREQKNPIIPAELYEAFLNATGTSADHKHFD